MGITIGGGRLMGEYNMDGIKQKSQRRRQKKRVQRNKRSMLAIGGIMLLLVVVVSVNGMTLRAKDNVYKEQEAELSQQLQEEKDRSGEVDKLKDYVSTDEYVEDVAKDKLGLVHDNEIIFKAK